MHLNYSFVERNINFAVFNESIWMPLFIEEECRIRISLVWETLL